VFVCWLLCCPIYIFPSPGRRCRRRLAKACGLSNKFRSPPLQGHSFPYCFPSRSSRVRPIHSLPTRRTDLTPRSLVARNPDVASLFSSFVGPPFAPVLVSGGGSAFLSTDTAIVAHPHPWLDKDFEEAQFESFLPPRLTSAPACTHVHSSLPLLC